MTDKMKKNYIALNWLWRCVVLVLAAVFSAAAQGCTSIKMAEEPLFKAESESDLQSIEVSRKEQIAEAIPSINLVGVSKSKKSLALGGLANIVREKAYGLQIGGLYNHFGMGGGLAVGGLLNTTGGSYYGVQVGGLANIVREKAYGLQIGGLCNHAGMGGGLAVGGLLNTTSASYYGVQVGGLGNISKDVAGLQVGGLFNATKNFYGLQIAGVMNATQDSYGLQLAGVENIARGNVHGLQLAGVTNVAKDVYGLQFAGVVNIAKEVRGVQFASILNIAERSDFPIGLINIIRNGEKGVAFTYDILGNSMVAFRSGGRYAYGILGVGYNQYLTEKIVAEAGYGIHIPLCRRLQVNNELKATAPINTSSTNFSYLLSPSVTLWKHFNLFGGPNINFFMSDTAEPVRLLPKHTLWDKKSGEGARCLYIGYQAGVQYIF